VKIGNDEIFISCKFEHQVFIFKTNIFLIGYRTGGAGQGKMQHRQSRGG
jgi:hypothetical protein